MQILQRNELYQNQQGVKKNFRSYGVLHFPFQGLSFTFRDLEPGKDLAKLNILILWIEWAALHKFQAIIPHLKILPKMAYFTFWNYFPYRSGLVTFPEATSKILHMKIR